MDYTELVTDVAKIPTDREGASKNIVTLLKHAKYLEGRTDITEPLARDLLNAAPRFIRKQLERLEFHIGDDADIIAWISRNLMELFFTLRYMYRSREKYDEVFAEQLKNAPRRWGSLRCPPPNWVARRQSRGSNLYL